MKFIFLIGLMVFSLVSTCQKVSNKQSKLSPEEIAVKQERCVFKRNYSDDSLLLLFPFMTTKAIKLISFQNSNDDLSGIIHNYFKGTYDSNYYHIDSTKIDTTAWSEVANLGKNEYVNLANLLFNYGRLEISNLGYEVINLCYRPRNAIVFYDMSDSIIAVVEICFECKRMRFFPKEFKLGYDCSTKFELFKKFFAREGIKYGIDE